MRRVTRKLPPPWQCHAKPAELSGRTCGHLNETGGVFYADLVCCASCGATKRASDSREERARLLAVGEQGR